MGKLAVHGIEFKAQKGKRVRALFTKNGKRQGIFGCGYVLNEEDTKKWIELEKQSLSEEQPIHLYIEQPK